MRCSICGAKLKKEGDICTNCYKAYQEEEDLKKDTKEQLKFKRKYSIPYEIAKYVEIMIIFILALILCISVGGFLEGLLVVLVYIAVMGVLLFWDKRVAMSTQAIFYERKARYIFKFLFFNIDKTVKYSDIKDITYFQTRRQKKFGYGDLCVYTKDVIPGASFLNGFQIKNVENVQEILNQLSQIVELEED